MPNSLKCRLKGLVRKGLLSEKDYSRIYTDNDVTEELEKIKEKIFNKQDEFMHSNLLSDCSVRYGLEIAEIIIDKEIAELKGENK